MAKSRIIKELVSEEVSLESALKRVKLMLVDLGDLNLLKWVDSELIGYTDTSEMPEYRKVRGYIRAAYVLGGSVIKGAPIPLQGIDEDMQEQLLSVPVKDSINGVKVLTEQDAEIGRMIDGDVCGYLSQLVGVRIFDARVVVSKNIVSNILSIVSNKVLDMLIELEKQFGILDDLDIEVEGHNIENVVQTLHYIVYQDYSVKVGDRNKIEKSNLVSQWVKGEVE